MHCGYTTDREEKTFSSILLGSLPGTLQTELTKDKLTGEKWLFHMRMSGTTEMKCKPQRGVRPGGLSSIFNRGQYICGEVASKRKVLSFWGQEGKIQGKTNGRQWLFSKVC